MREGPARDGYDVVIVGGGAAGLSAATVLGRCRRTVLVVDAGQPRNAPAAHAQGFLTRDGTPPGELLAHGREEARRYGVEVLADRVVRARSGGTGFDIRIDAGHDVHARRLLVCTGLVDRLPDLPGLAERWGRDAVHCPFCHGWEGRDEPTVALVGTALDLHKAVLVTALTSRLTLVTESPMTAASLAQEPDGRLLIDAGVPVVPGPAVEILVQEDRLAGVRTADGTVLDASVVYCTPPVAPCDTLLAQLGAKTTGSIFGPVVAVDDEGATSVAGVWAAGNAVDPTAQLVHAASAAYRAAQAIATSLAAEDLRVTAVR
ncbi:MAG: NAD(P)/FAD-dependent oxidoreductase [Actinocatenispora sp.]